MTFILQYPFKRNTNVMISTFLSRIIIAINIIIIPLLSDFNSIYSAHIS